MAEYGGEAVHTPLFVTCGARGEYGEYGGVWVANQAGDRAPRVAGYNLLQLARVTQIGWFMSIICIADLWVVRA
jgi:hypothetical protein